MSSKKDLKRFRREHTLLALLHDYRGDTVEAVARRLAPFAEPGDDIAGSVDCLLRALERMLAASQQESLRGRARHGGTMDRVGELRRERNEAAHEMRTLLVEIRDTTTLLFGRKASNHWLRIQGATARERSPHDLLFQARSALRRLESPDVDLPEPRAAMPGWEDPIQASRRRWSEALRAAFTRLEEAKTRVEEETHRTDATRLLKSDSVDAYHQELTAIANLQEALLVVGEEPEIARTIWDRQRPVGRPARRKRIRSTRRRLGRKEPAGKPKEATSETTSHGDPKTSSDGSPKKRPL
jgi:hypothetical protein